MTHTNQLEMTFLSYFMLPLDDKQLKASQHYIVNVCLS
jgi:hypothetical protein